MNPKQFLFRLLMIVGIILPVSFPNWLPVFAQVNTADFREVRSIFTSEYGISHPQGLAFSSAANSFLVWGADGNITPISMYKELGSRLSINAVVENPLNVAFDNSTNSLFILNRGRSELAKITGNQQGLLAPSAKTSARFDIRDFALKDAQGITFDPDSGRLFILDAAAGQIVAIRPSTTSGFEAAAALREGRVGRINIGITSYDQLRGVAFNPSNKHLYVSDPNQDKLYELTEAGQTVSTYDLSSLQLQDTGSMLFAPSADRTDAPSTMDLFLLDSAQLSSGGTTSDSSKIVELSLIAPAGLPAGTQLLPATLVRTVDTSKTAWNPSSPDPSGIDYWPLTGRFITTDSEVEEMPPYWVGSNVFDATLSGTLISTCTTYTGPAGGKILTGDWNNYSNEPTGIAINPANNHFFISDDSGGGKLFEVSPGPDNTYCTSDDVITEISFATDAEDVAYGNNTVFIAGGVDAEVWWWDLGANGVLGGGDDGPVNHFDTASLGFSDLEGIGYNADAGTLFFISTHSTDKYLGETTLSGTLLHAYDLSFMTGGGNLRSDVAYAPSSSNPAVKNIYIVSRGVDNGADPNENDGKWWEIAIGGNQPTVTPVTASSSPTFTRTPTQTSTPTSTSTKTPTPTQTSTPTSTSTKTSTPAKSPTPTITATFPSNPGNTNGPDTTGVFRPSNGVIFLKNSNDTGFADVALNYGIPGDYPVVGDWDGNGTTTIGVYRNGSFYLRNSNTVGFADMIFAFGQPGDQPIAGDWNGDGVDTIGVYRPSNGQFLLRNSNDAGAPEISFFLGNVGDVGIAGDWTGKGYDTVGVFRPSNGVIFLKNSNDTGFADVALNYGIPGDKPVTGDWNGDGTDTIGVYRNGQFLLRNSNTVGFADMVFGLGNPGDMPIAGNWDGLP